MEPNSVGVLGLGSWGTAIAHHLARTGVDVLGWTANEAIVRSISERRVNDRYLSGFSLHPALAVTSSLDEALKRKILLVALPAAALSGLELSLQGLSNRIVVSLTKGIEPTSKMLPLTYLETALDASSTTCVLSGPSFARDVVAERPCGLVAASRDRATALTVAKLFSNEGVRVYTSDDTIGVELGGICKNVIALAAGIVDGLGRGESARSGLITRGLAEMMRLAGAMQANPLTLCGLSGLGDLIMTATSETSRNRTVGFRLGKGDTLEHILTTLGSVAEGVYAAPHVLELGKSLGVEMPITEGVESVLSGKRAAAVVMQTLMTRPLKDEFES